MAKVVIFGGSGFLGTHLIAAFQADKTIQKVFVADVKEPIGLPSKCTYVKTDVHEEINKQHFDIPIDSIINLAAVHKSPGHPSHEYFETNILGARNICNFAESVNCNRIVFTSSIAPYGPSEEEKDEDAIPMPVIPYGISKIIAEGIHREWMLKDKKRKLAILRPAVIFGKGEKGNFTRIATALRKGIFVYPGRKNTIKSCVYVKDVCGVIDFVMKLDESFSLFNVCYPNKTTTEDVVNAFHAALSFKKSKMVIPKMAIDSGAALLRIINTPFIRSLGLDPVRIAKLVNSTNISSQKLVGAGFEFKYNLVSAIQDWATDCNGNVLY